MLISILIISTKPKKTLHFWRNKILIIWSTISADEYEHSSKTYQICNENRSVRISYCGSLHFFFFFFFFFALWLLPGRHKRWNNVNSTLIQRHDVESTLNRLVSTLCVHWVLSFMFGVFVIFVPCGDRRLWWDWQVSPVVLRIPGGNATWHSFRNCGSNYLHLYRDVN